MGDGCWGSQPCDRRLELSAPPPTLTRSLQEGEGAGDGVQPPAAANDLTEHAYETKPPLKAQWREFKEGTWRDAGRVMC